MPKNVKVNSVSGGLLRCNRSSCVVTYYNVLCYRHYSSVWFNLVTDIVWVSSLKHDCVKVFKCVIELMTLLQVEICDRKGKDIPLGWGVDSSGKV